MAEPQRHGDGWRVQIKINGRRESRKFSTSREAKQWRDQRTLELQRAKAGKLGEGKTFTDALIRYREEIAPTRAYPRNETVRINSYLADPDLPLTVPLTELKAGHFDAWKKRRSAEVKSSTVNRHLNLMGSVLAYCWRDWSWVEHSPLAGIRRPKDPPHREVTITWSQIRKMLRIMGYRPGQPPRSVTGMVAYSFLISLQTGMRSTEITSLKWAQIGERTALLPKTKNGSARTVPLAPRTRRLFGLLRGLDDEAVFLVDPPSRCTLFRRARIEAGLKGFTFHDARHTAATRIGAQVGQPGKLSFPEFCYVFGWKDPKHALIYVNPDPARLADKL